MSDQLIEQLKKLKEVKPSQEWIDQSREFLMSEIRKDKESRYEEIAMQDSWAKRLVYQTRFVRLAWKPVGVFALVALFFMSSAGLTVMASQKAKAGDRLFVVRRALEKSQSMMTQDSVRRVELASGFLANRVNDLQYALVQESQLKSAGEKTNKVELAVTEVKRQLDDVNKQLSRLKAEDDDKDNETGVAALILNEEIKDYKVKLVQANEEVGGQLDDALVTVDDINSGVLEVIVAEYEEDELAMAQEDLEKELGEYMAGIEEKVAVVEEAIEEAQFEAEGAELKEQLAELAEAEVKIEEAKEALAKGEYGLVLVLSKDSNEILRILYGDMSTIVKVDASQDKGEVHGQATTTEPAVEEVEEPPYAEASEDKEVADEFDVGVN